MRFCSPFVLVLVLLPLAHAQTVTPVASAGKATHLGVVRQPRAISVDDRGSWVVRVRFEGSSLGAIVRDGRVVLARQRVAHATDVPEAVFQSRFDSVDAFGDDRIVSVAGATVPGVPPRPFRFGIFFDTVPLVHQLTDPGPPFSPEATYSGDFYHVRANRAGQVLGLSGVYDPADPNGGGDALQVFDVA